MTLGFSTQINGKPNYFPEKIHHSLMENKLLTIADRHNYRYKHEQKFGKVWDWDHPNIKPKPHTIREDSHDRWKPGMDIHMVINNRTKSRFQFAPVVKCVSVQEIVIDSYESDIKSHFTYSKYLGNYRYKVFRVWIDGKMRPVRELEKLAINDGFDSVEDFFAYFNKDFKGKIIHWTDLKY